MKRDPHTVYKDTIRRVQRFALDRIEQASKSAKSLAQLQAEIRAAFITLEHHEAEAEERYRRKLNGHG